MTRASLRPLEPRYVSTVDSGNLAGHLLVLGNACRERGPIARCWIGEAFAGIEDARPARRGGRARARRRPAHPDGHPGRSRRGLPGPGRRASRAPDEPWPTWAASPPSPRRPGRHARGHRADPDARSAATARTPTSWSGPRLRAPPSPATSAISRRSCRGRPRRGCPARRSRPRPRGRTATPSPHVVLSDPGRSDRPAATPLPQSSSLCAMRTRTTGPHGRMRSRASTRSSAASSAPPSPPEPSSVASRRWPQVAKELFDAMQFGFLFDPTRKIFSIGYRVTDGSLDPSGYDLLASEARLASFIAIAKGDVPVSHWFHLGRPMTPVALGSALVSWSGSMFEYLMPALVMRLPAGQLAPPDVSPGRPAPDELRRGARCPVGHLRIGLQRPRPRSDLSVFELRRPGPGARAGPQRGPGRRALCDRAGRDGRPRGRRPQPLAPRRGGCAGSLRLLRGARLHEITRPRRGAGGDRARLHGAPPGHDPRRARRTCCGRA